MADEGQMEIRKKIRTALDGLKSSKCYNLVVRKHTTFPMFLAALRNCDVVMVAAHGANKAPFLALSGSEGLEFPEDVGASECWVGACNAGAAIAGFKKSSKADETPPTFSKPPDEDYDEKGNTYQMKLFPRILDELNKRLAEKDCCKKRLLCFLVGPQ